MKSIWSFFLLAPLFGMNYCSIEDNVGSQPLSLSKSALTSLAKWQIDHSLTNEPFLAYNKLNDGTLVMFGASFGDEITKKTIDFLQKVTSNFRIHSVVFKWFYFDEKMLRIFDVFHEKLQNSVKSVTFKKCYFPETFVIADSLELNCVTECFFIECFTSEESLKEMFKIFKNAPVTSLTISKVFDYEQDKSIYSNDALKRIANQDVVKRSLKVDNLKLDSFFPNINSLSLSYCSLDFDHFSLTSLKTLTYVDLNEDTFKNLCEQKFYECFHMNVKNIRMPDWYYYEKLSFTENAFANNIIIDPPYPFKYDEIICVKALSVFSSLSFKMNRMKRKMTAIKEYIKNYGGAINTVTSVDIYMVFNYQSVANMIKLLSYFPNVENVQVVFMNNCNASMSDDKLYQLFSTLPVMNVKKLSMYFNQKRETTAFYRFIVELMKLCQTMTSLEFNYCTANSFAINIAEMVERENIHFPNLDTLTVDYMSDNIDVSIDLFYVAKYNIRNLTMKMLESIQNLDRLDQFKCFSVDTLNFYVYNCYFGELVNNFLTKFPHLSNLNWNSICCSLNLNSALQNMKRLRKVIIRDTSPTDDFPEFLSLLPQDLESLEIECYSYEVEDIKKSFKEKFPSSTFTVTITEM